MSDIQELLKKISLIVQKDEAEKNQQKQSGKQFNIFSVIGLKSEEVRLHSAFIAELLNPNGSHGQGNLFLNLFLETVMENRSKNFSSATVVTEAYIGEKTDETGGRLDIFIRLKKVSGEKKSIIIENKIYASDQENQLLRYRNFAQNSDYSIYYLTLDGHQPSEYSTNKSRECYWKCISYGNHIRNWLQKCANALGSEKQNLMNSIDQYKEIIDELTEKEMNMKPNEKVMNILLADENLKSAELIVQSFDAAKDKILEKYLIPELKKLAKKHGLQIDWEVDDVITNLKCKYGSFYFLIKSKKSNTYICFEFQGKNYQNLVYGLHDAGENRKLRKALDRLPKFYDNSEYWPCYRDMDTCACWNAAEFIQMKNDPKAFVNFIDEKIKEILSYLEKNDLKNDL